MLFLSRLHREPYCFGAPGSSWGFGAFLKGPTSVVGLKVEESAGYSLQPPTIPAGPDIRTRDLRVTSEELFSKTL